MSKLIAAAKSFVREEDGAAMVEYALLVGLIAVVSILVITALGDSVWKVFDESQKSLDTVTAQPKAAS